MHSWHSTKANLKATRSVAPKGHSTVLIINYTIGNKIEIPGREMKIGELAVQTGLSNSRIRYYERIGLLKAVERMPNGYRRYLEEAVVILKLIVIAQDAGFSLEEIQTLVPNDLSSWDHDLLAKTLSRKIAEIEVQQAQLAASKAKLLAIADGTANRPEGLSCADNSKRVLSLVPINTLGDG